MPAHDLFGQQQNPDFDRFWASYPRRVSKLDAQKAFSGALRYAKAADIIAGAARYAAATRQTEVRFIKHPASWLRAGGWMDDMAAVAPPPAQSVIERRKADLRQRIENEHGIGRQGNRDLEAPLGIPFHARH